MQALLQTLIFHHQIVDPLLRVCRALLAEDSSLHQPPPALPGEPGEAPPLPAPTPTDYSTSWEPTQPQPPPSFPFRLPASSGGGAPFLTVPS